MDILYYDCFAGISGDMNLGAMIDLGVPFPYLREELSKLGLDEFSLSVTRAKRMGIEGTAVTVMETLRSSPSSLVKNSEQVHRGYHKIEKLVRESGLNSAVKEMAMKIFNRIALAEAKIHGISMEAVHFHEVGAIDSIVDIVGAAICIDYLKPGRILSAPPELGKGMVTCAHGVFPVPAPATLEMLAGIPVRTGGTDHEATTPTGAAILASLVDEFSSKIAFTVKKTGYGIGFRETKEKPNVLRVILAETSGSYGTEDAILLECNIDDMNPEHYDYLITRMLELGADDVFVSPIIMKKTRPANILSVLAKPQLVDILSRFIFEETTTLGLRRMPVEKSILQRETIVVQTKWGEVRIKQGIWNGQVIKSKPEYDDCVKIAHDHSIPLSQVIKEVEEAMKKQG